MPNERKHVDRRITRSRDAIVAAFERLLVTEDIDKITVSAIAREANIDRKTFYVHFGSIDGLLDAIAERYVDQIIDEVHDSLEASGDIDSQALLERFFCSINRLICENLVLNRRFMVNVPSDALLMRVRRPFEKRLLEDGIFSNQVPREVVEYYLSFLLGGIISVYRAWLLSDGSTPIETVSGVANSLMLSGLGGLAARQGVADGMPLSLK